jgi:hypothetical protein
MAGCGCQDCEEKGARRRIGPDAVKLKLAASTSVTEGIGSWEGPCWLQVGGQDAYIRADVVHTRIGRNGQPVEVTERLEVGFAGGRRWVRVERDETVSITVLAVAIATGNHVDEYTGLYGAGTFDGYVLVTRHEQRGEDVGGAYNGSIAAAGSNVRVWPPAHSKRATVYLDGSGYVDILNQNGTIVGRVVGSGVPIPLQSAWLSLRITSEKPSSLGVTVAWEP